jgi:hypothetical protein
VLFYKDLLAELMERNEQLATYNSMLLANSKEEQRRSELMEERLAVSEKTHVNTEVLDDEQVVLLAKAQAEIEEERKLAKAEIEKERLLLNQEKLRF